MLWIIEESLFGTTAERKARLNFIKEISGDKRVSWQKLSWRLLPVDYYYCQTDDGVNGVFITAHMYLGELLFILGMLRPVTRDFFVLNTCKMREGVDEEILSYLMNANSEIQLYFAKQDYDTESEIYTNFISDVGNFGFMTSKSERIMFFNRGQGVAQAINKGFDMVRVVNNRKENEDERFKRL